MELSPRTSPTSAPGETAGPGLGEPAPRRSSGGRRLPAMLILVAIVAVGGFVVLNALGSATLFFRNADEAVAQRGDLGTSRFRLQGTVIDEAIEPNGDRVTFAVTYNGVEVVVQHRGDPPELFEPDIPVVLEGSFALPADAAGDTEADAGDVLAATDPAELVFASDRMLVKHTNEYEAENDDRLRDAEQGGNASSTASDDGGAGQASGS